MQVALLVPAVSIVGKPEGCHKTVKFANESVQNENNSVGVACGRLNQSSNLSLFVIAKALLVHATALGNCRPLVRQHRPVAVYMLPVLQSTEHCCT